MTPAAASRSSAPSTRWRSRRSASPPDASIYLGLRTAYWRVANARDDDALRGVVDDLWQIAVQLEDGNMADAERELRAAEDALRQALDRGAGDDELKQLTDNLRQALDRFMRELAEEMRRNPGREARKPLDNNARILRPQDLQAMIDRLENLARSGSRDAARRTLEELQAMLDRIDRHRSGDRPARTATATRSTSSAT